MELSMTEMPVSCLVSVQAESPAAQQRVAEMLPDHQNDVSIWYLDSNSSGVSKITKAGEYTVYMLITNNCYTLFDGTSEVKAVTIMHIQVKD
jgi:hypothetical protein